MSMKCPVCHITLNLRSLEPNLPSRACAQCGGQWIEGARYFRWLETRKNEPEVQAAEVQEAPPDAPARAKICPTCGRLLGHSKVGHGVAFELDRCGGCGGIWFDANEWETLESRGLHDDVHFVFSAAWQAQVAREERERRHQAMLLEKLGPDDLSEIQRIRRWLDEHPRRAELYGVLLDNAEGLTALHRRG